MSEVKTDKISPRTASGTLTVGDSGDTLTVPSGVTFNAAVTGSGAAITALNATNLASGTVPTARLGSGTASASTFLRGDNTWASAGEDNTPAFMVGCANDTNITGIASDTYTKVAFGTEVYDSDYAYDTSNYKFTVPSGEGGTYIFYWNLEMVTSSDAQNTLLENSMVIYKNGSTSVQSAAGTHQFHRNSTSRREVMSGTHTQVLSASDYLELYVKMVCSSSTGTLTHRSWFGGHKLLL